MVVSVCDDIKSSERDHIEEQSIALERIEEGGHNHSAPFLNTKETDLTFDSDDQDTGTVKNFFENTPRKGRSWRFFALALLLLGSILVTASLVYYFVSRPSSAAVTENRPTPDSTYSTTSPSQSPRLQDPLGTTTLMPPSSPSDPGGSTMTDRPSMVRDTPAPSFAPAMVAAATTTALQSPPALFPSSSPTETSNCPMTSIEMPPLPGKKGIGLTLREEGQKGDWVRNIPRLLALNTSWNYGWGTSTAEAQPSSSEFIPMIWGGKNTAKVQSRIDELKPLIEVGSVKRILGFNEPDMKQQSNMTVQQVSEAWPILESAGVPLVGPSVGHIRGEFLPQFMEVAKTNCHRVDWVGVHWYGGANFNQFKQQLTALYEEHKLPILITEFAPADWKATTPSENRWTQSQVLGFMKQALPWLEATEWIAGYAWFTFEHDSPVGTSSSLFDENDSINPLGRFYASVTPSNPQGDQEITI